MRQFFLAAPADLLIVWLAFGILKEQREIVLSYVCLFCFFIGVIIDSFEGVIHAKKRNS